VAAPAGLIIWLMANINIGDMSILARGAKILNPIGYLLGMDGYILLAFILGLPANEIIIPIIVMSYMATGSLIETENLSALRELLTANGWTWLTAVCTMLFSPQPFPLWHHLTDNLQRNPKYEVDTDFLFGSDNNGK